MEDQSTIGKEFVFRITTTNGVTSIDPEPSSQTGLLPGGNAHVKKRGSGLRRLTWRCSQEFSIQFTGFASDDPGDPDPGPIATTIPVGATFDSKDWVYSIDVRAGSGNETVAYKYSVLFGGVVAVDPVVIVDR